MKYHRVSNKSTSNTADAISGAGTVQTSGAPEFIPVFSGVRVAQSDFLCSVFFRLMLFLLTFFLLDIVLSVLRFATSGCSFVIFKLFFQQSMDATRVYPNIRLQNP